jgi:hypothetical protein
LSHVPSPQYSLSLVLLEMEHGALPRLGKHFATELYPTHTCSTNAMVCQIFLMLPESADMEAYYTKD